MQSITFFEVASQHAKWLSERQRVVSENIANASTPRYRAKDVDSFAVVLNKNIGMARTHPSHIDRSDSNQNIRIIESPLDQTVGVQVSGNTVGLTNELYKSADIKNSYELNALLVSKFNSMIMRVAKG
ncbi:flagellar basal body protein [Candidatus Liberibacter sp.]|uniref:flagellar basal body protein n=1 Tax=Candidatus Liberibacter sp. TaxID=34022 RepID=UPI0015F5AB06|nr:flagellar basal body protein [Candidatus Liberibacter sp.]MBA5723621.1 flagellar basal body rod protein FlgB [Candidatus Liberibacter sp.]